jgi:putative transcriptional regulator
MNHNDYVNKNGEKIMIDINKLLESKRLEVKITEIKIDKHFVKQFRTNNHLTQIALANVLGVTKKTIEKWEQGVNNINGSSAVLLKLLNDNPTLLSQLYSVKVVEGKQEADDYETIESKVITVSGKVKKTASILQMPFAAIF